MCGILGVISAPGSRPTVSPDLIARMRDTMAARGPDEARLTAAANVIFAVRRLAVSDPLARATQPAWSPDRRFLLLYNGELYNDAELRAELSGAGVRFRTGCDTETLVHAFAAWGLACLSKIRGMFSLAVYDFTLNTLTLARDPLGIKPLYFARIGQDIAFASHIPALLAHPAASRRPDLAACSAYLTTLHPTTGNRTLYEGVSTLRPGQALQVVFTPSGPQFNGLDYWREPAHPDRNLTLDEATEQVRESVTESVRRHVRADVPACMLLSGGLDSAIIAAIWKQQGGGSPLHSWCAADPADGGGDARHAREMASRLGTVHHEHLVTSEEFHAIWPALVAATGFPLSTPNEVAIHALAREIRAEAPVLVSGEGADELFGGYGAPLLAAVDGLRAALPDDRWPGPEAARERYRRELHEQYGTDRLGNALEHYLRCNAWIHPDLKPALFSEQLRDAAAGDALLLDELTRHFTPDSPATDPAEHALIIQRRLNLTNLLRRLDTATMSASVEGRTPFADVCVAQTAFSIPLDHKIAVEPEGDGGWTSSAVAVAQNRVTTKLVLRRAFADLVPESVLMRPKASFPLPFQQWLEPRQAHAVVEVFQESPLIRTLLEPSARALIAARPHEYWQSAWPLLNLALWDAA